MGRILSYVGWPLVVASGYGILHWMANRAVFYPAPYPQGPWNLSVELGVTDVWLLTSDGVRLQGWWKAPADARLATVFFHGNAGNLSYRGEHLREITAAGSAVLMVDYRGYGKSAGTPTEKGLYADADAAYENVLARGYRPEQIVIHGESLGTAVAVDLAARRGCAGLVLEAPFTSGRDVAQMVLPVLGPLLVWGFDSKARIRNIRVPVLFIHGDHDTVIPQKLGRALFEATGEPKSFWEVPGAGHNDIVEAAGPAYSVRLREFYQGCLQTPRAP